MSCVSEWLSGRHGTMCPMEQAKVWALVYVRDKFHVPLRQEDIAKAVTKFGGGHPMWCPGKVGEDAEQTRPKPLFTKQKQQAVANAAMTLKNAGFEPTAAAVKERCPVATWNDER